MKKTGHFCQRLVMANFRLLIKGLSICLFFLSMVVCCLRADTYYLQSMGGSDSGPPMPFDPYNGEEPMVEIAPGTYVINDGDVKNTGDARFMLDGSIDPTNIINNSTNDDAVITNCPCCNYPTNAAFKWMLVRNGPGSELNPISFSPQNRLYMPFYGGYLPEGFYGIQAENVNTNNPDYPSVTPFITFESTITCGLSPLVFATDGSACMNSYTLPEGNEGGGDDNVYYFDSSLGLKWNFDLQQTDVGYNIPVISSDGTVYVASRRILVALTNAPGLQTSLTVTNHDDGYIPDLPLIATTYSLTNVGVKWVFSYPDAYISNTNLLVVPTPNGVGFVGSQPAIGSDGTLFINTSLGQLLAIDPTNGGLKWATSKLRQDIGNDGEYGVDGSISTAPVIGGDGTIYFGADTAFYSVDPNAPTTNRLMGFKTYYTNLNELFILNPIIGGDGTIYAEAIGNGPFNFYYYDPYFLEYFGPTNTCTNALYAFDTQLNPKWITYLGTNAADGFAAAQGGYPNPSFMHDKFGSLALGSDGELYMADWDGMFYSFCSSTGATNYSFNTFDVAPADETRLSLHSPLIGPDGTIYFDAVSPETSRSYLFAFSGSPIAHAPWPEDQKNARRDAVVVPLSMWGNLSAPIMQTDGFQFTVDAPTNTIDCIFASTNLLNWDNIGQIQLVLGSTNFLDTNAAGFEKRFYTAQPQ